MTDSLFFSLCSDTIHIVMAMLERGDRVRLATVCRALGEETQRFHTESPLRPVPDPWFFVIRYLGVSGSPTVPDFTKKSSYIIDALNVSSNLNCSGRLPECASIVVLGLTDILSRPSYERNAKNEWIYLLQNAPHAIVQARLSAHALLVQVDLSSVTDTTIPLSSLVQALIYSTTPITPPSTLRSFFRDAYHDPDHIHEYTPDARILGDPLPAPLILPQFPLRLRRHQQSCIDYFSRMERRAARDQPLGSFRRWQPVKRGDQVLWLDMFSIGMVSVGNSLSLTDDQPLPDPDVLLRDAPPTQVEYTSRMFWLTDESGLGKTVTMLALMLGSPALIECKSSTPGIFHTRASLVLAETMMLKGRSDWRDLPTQLYPASKVHVVTDQTQWNALSRRQIQDADLIIMSYPYFKAHYHASSEQPDPERLSLLSFQWQRLVLDDYAANEGLTFSKLGAHVYYILSHDHAWTPGFGRMEMRIREQGDGEWRWYASHTHNGVFMFRHIRSQCTWRRTVRSVASELTRPQLVTQSLPIPASEPETRIIHVSFKAFDVPVIFRRSFLPNFTTRDTYINSEDQVFSTSLDDSIHSLQKTLLDIYQNPSQYVKTPEKPPPLLPCPLPKGLVRQRHGSLITAVLVLLRAHWRKHPTEPVLLVCQSQHAVARLARILKDQHLPIRVVGKPNVTYSGSDLKILKSLGRKQALAHLVDLNQLTVAINRFVGIQYVFFLAHSAQDRATSDVIYRSITRPVSAQEASPLARPVHLTRLYLTTDPIDMADCDMTALPYSELDTDRDLVFGF